jgi:cysteine sulfinate desulfinase/cysteine desulfurase-like protein
MNKCTPFKLRAHNLKPAHWHQTDNLAKLKTSLTGFQFTGFQLCTYLRLYVNMTRHMHARTDRHRSSLGSNSKFDQNRNRPQTQNNSGNVSSISLSNLEGNSNIISHPDFDICIVQMFACLNACRSERHLEALDLTDMQVRFSFAH